MLSNKACDAFLYVAETGSFEKAASQLCITPAAVTLRVQALEKDLGQVLILRERPCRLTNAGEQLFEHLKHVQLKESLLIQQFQSKRAQQNFYKFHIGINADSLATWFFPAIQKLVTEDKISINLQIDDQSKTHQLLEDGLVNACISASPKTIKGCQAVELGAMEYIMVCTPAFQQKWFKHNIIHREHVRAAPAIIFNEKDYLHGDKIEQLYGLTLRDYPYYFIPSSTAFVDAILHELGFGYVPTLQIQHELATGQLVEIMPQARDQIKLYWHHWLQQPAILEKFAQTVIEYAKLHLIPS